LRTDGRKEINRRRLEGQRQMEEKDKIIVRWAQEDVETSNNLLNNNNNNNNNNTVTLSSMSAAIPKH